MIFFMARKSLQNSKLLFLRCLDLLSLSSRDCNRPKPLVVRGVNIQLDPAAYPKSHGGTTVLVPAAVNLNKSDF